MADAATTAEAAGSECMQRAILLQIDEPTNAKLLVLKEFQNKALQLANSLLKQRKSRKPMDLHRETYLSSKKTTKFNSQVICDIERSVARIRAGSIRGITTKFNVPRNCKTFSTKSKFFVEFGIYPGKRFAIPIKNNSCYTRYNSLLQNGWACKTYGVTPDLQVVAYLSKEDAPIPRKNVVGIDVNRKCFAATVLSGDGNVLKQLYFGKDIWIRRKKIMERRSRLQSLADKGSSRAKRSLGQLKKSEYNFVRNRIGEVVKQMIYIAKEYDAGIAIEDLRRFKPVGRNFNREVLRIPFYKFRNILASRCFDNKIKLDILDAYHTSKWCPNCGAVGEGHSRANYALFRCGCGLEVNSDRKASLAIAIKSQLKREHSQPFNWRAPVNGLLRQNDVGLDYVAVQHPNQLTESLAL